MLEYFFKSIVLIGMLPDYERVHYCERNVAPLGFSVAKDHRYIIAREGGRYYLVDIRDFERIAKLLSRFFPMGFEFWDVEGVDVELRCYATICRGYVILEGRGRSTPVHYIPALPVHAALLLARNIAGPEAARELWWMGRVSLYTSAGGLLKAVYSFENEYAEWVYRVADSLDAGRRALRSLLESDPLLCERCVLTYLRRAAETLARTDAVAETPVYTVIWVGGRAPPEYANVPCMRHSRDRLWAGTKQVDVEYVTFPPYSLHEVLPPTRDLEIHTRVEAVVVQADGASSAEALVEELRRRGVNARLAS